MTAVEVHHGPRPRMALLLSITMRPMKAGVDLKMMPPGQTIHPPNRYWLVSARLDGRTRINAVVSPNRSRAEITMELLAKLGHDNFQRRCATPAYRFGNRQRIDESLKALPLVRHGYMRRPEGLAARGYQSRAGRSAHFQQISPAYHFTPE
jgi:hypothetical protein